MHNWLFSELIRSVGKHWFDVNNTWWDELPELGYWDVLTPTTPSPPPPPTHACNMTKSTIYTIIAWVKGDDLDCTSVSKDASQTQTIQTDSLTCEFRFLTVSILLAVCCCMKQSIWPLAGCPLRCSFHSDVVPGICWILSSGWGSSRSPSLLL